MKKILVAGNSNYGLAEEIKKFFIDYDVTFASRSTGYDLSRQEFQQKFATDSLDYDIIILCSALYKFNQTVLLDTVYKKLKEADKRTHIVCIGSTADRSKKATDWLYSAEKKALRDCCNSLGMIGVWKGGPRITLISFGSLSNVQEKHPERVCMPIEQAPAYIKWVIEQPAHLHINELSLDPLQS